MVLGASQHCQRVVARPFTTLRRHHEYISSTSTIRGDTCMTLISRATEITVGVVLPVPSHNRKD
eukprot:4405804-Amphidinium_carterae.1